MASKPASARFFPRYRRTSPAAVSNCRRTIHRFDSANSVVSCAVFLAKPRKRGFHIIELALDHAKGMLDFPPCLRFDLLDLASGFLEHAAFAQVLVGATMSRNLPDHRPPLMLRPFLHAGITRVRTDDVLCAMQQVGDLRYIGHVRGSAMNVMHQTRFSIRADVGLQSGKAGVLPLLPPLRTVLESHPSYGSSLPAA